MERQLSPCKEAHVANLERFGQEYKSDGRSFLPFRIEERKLLMQLHPATERMQQVVATHGVLRSDEADYSQFVERKLAWKDKPSILQIHVQATGKSSSAVFNSSSSLCLLVSKSFTIKDLHIELDCNQSRSTHHKYPPISTSPASLWFYLYGSPAKNVPYGFHEQGSTDLP